MGRGYDQYFAYPTEFRMAAVFVILLAFFVLLLWCLPARGDSFPSVDAHGRPHAHASDICVDDVPFRVWVHLDGNRPTMMHSIEKMPGPCPGVRKVKAKDESRQGWRKPRRMKA